MISKNILKGKLLDIVKKLRYSEHMNELPDNIYGKDQLDDEEPKGFWSGFLVASIIYAIITAIRYVWS